MDSCFRRAEITVVTFVLVWLGKTRLATRLKLKIGIIPQVVLTFSLLESKRSSFTVVLTSKSFYENIYKELSCAANCYVVQVVLTFKFVNEMLK